MQTDIITLHQFFVDATSTENIPIKVPSKECKKCRVLKPLEEFSKNNSKKDKLDIYCKCCMNAKKAIYYQENKEEKCAKQAIYDAEHAEEIAARQVIYYVENKEELVAKNNERQKERRVTDPLYKLQCNMRTLMHRSFKNGNFKKTSKTANILGCSYEEMQLHLESQFQPNMTWQNQGDWHIDHFFPISWSTNKAQALLLNQYVNLRPLWAVDNHFKSAKAPYTIDKETGEINILLECDREYINTNFEKLEAFLKELEDLA